MSEDILKAMEELRAYIEEAVKEGRFVDEATGFSHALDLLREDEKAGSPNGQRRQGGQWKDQVKIASDFDELPDDIADSFGIQ